MGLQNSRCLKSNLFLSFFLVSLLGFGLKGYEFLNSATIIPFPVALFVLPDLQSLFPATKNASQQGIHLSRRYTNSSRRLGLLSQHYKNLSRQVNTLSRHFKVPSLPPGSSILQAGRCLVLAKRQFLVLKKSDILKKRYTHSKKQCFCNILLSLHKFNS